VSRTTVAILFVLVLLGALTPAGAEAATVRYGAAVPVAGIGVAGYSGDGGAATDARISDSGGIAVAADGTLYLADQWSGRVRAVGRDGVIDTVPGGRALRSPATDGPAAGGIQYSPSDRPYDVAAGPDGALYVIGHDSLRRLAPDGTSTKILDTLDTQVVDPSDLAVAGGNLYLAGRGRLVRILPTGAVTVLAGGGQSYPGDAEGRPATEVRALGDRTSIAATEDGTVYLVAPRDQTDENYLALYRIDPDATFHLVAGAGAPGYAGDGGPAVKARLSGNLGGVAVAGDTVYVSDRGNGVIRVIDRDGDIDTITPPAATETGGLPGGGLAVGPGGDLYVKAGARVYRLPRKGTGPEPARARTPDYPDRYAGDEPGTVRTVAGSGAEEKLTTGVPPGGQKGRVRLAVAPNGDRYYADAARHVVVRVTRGGAASVVAGTGKPAFSGDGGPARAAALNTPTGAAVGPDGSVYVADSGNERLRRIDPAGVITTVAGNGQAGTPGGLFGETVAVAGDGGPATAATVTPNDVAVAADGTLYVAEDDDKRISRITPDGVLTTVAGGGDRWMDDADGHPAREADLFQPQAVTLGRDGSVYFIDNGAEITDPAVRMVDPAGIVRTVAGDSYRSEDEGGFGGDGGPGTRAELNNPVDLDAGPDGVLYIADSYNNRVRALDPAGTITTFAGTGERADSGDGGAPAKAAVLEPQSVAVGADGSVQVVNGPGDRIRVFDGGDVTTEKIGAPAEKRRRATDLAIDARGLAVDHDGDLLVTHAAGVYSVDRRGMVTTDLDDQRYVNARVEVGPDGSRYVVTAPTVTRVTGDGASVVVAGGGPLKGDVDGEPATLASFERIMDVAVGPKGTLYVALTDVVYRVGEDGTLARVFRGGGVRTIAVGPAEDLYVAVADDQEHDHLYRVTPTGTRTLVAGGGEDDTDDDVDGEDATDVPLFGASDVVVDGAGNVYVGTFDGVRRIDPDGVITTVADNPSVDDSRLQMGPLAVDRAGNVYFVDNMRHDVKVVVRPGEMSGPFPWGTVVWLTLGVVVLLGAAYVGRRWWLGRPAAATPPTA
jgi:glucose/arabinose dehydrogenase